MLVGGFGAALTISRIPTQFVSAAFAPIMVSLAALVESGDEAGHRRALARALRIASILGVAFVALYWLLGPWVLSVYVGSAYAVPRWVLACLAAASSGLFIAAVEQASLAALERWRRIAISWLLGAAHFRGGVAPAIDPLAACILGAPCGCCYRPGDPEPPCASPRGRVKYLRRPRLGLSAKDVCSTWRIASPASAKVG